MAEQLSPEQVERIAVALEGLVARGNQFAVAIARAIKDKPPDDKRALVAGIYARLFETMLTINMAMDSKRTPDEVRAALTAKAPIAGAGGAS